ncbi:TlpA disulfide reductase family protein [Mucilaginibacter sp. CAU 1740]|uniref:TlpA family protein disulfide reductase n=1 Tax=Mucilaginibacter sp. CAU 1740 TaxID=3140365 RepID=UPI00325AE4D9
MKQITVLLISLFISFFAYGQNKAALSLQKTVDKVQSLKTLSYSYHLTQKNPLSEGDTNYINMRCLLKFNAHGLTKQKRDKTISGKGQPQFEVVLRNDTLYQLDLDDSTYSFHTKPEADQVNLGMMSVIEQIQYALEKNRPNIFQRKDTVINGLSCSYFFIKSFDEMVNGRHDFTYDYVAINKATLLPVFFKEIGAGITEKGGQTIGRLTFFEEAHFTNIKINQAIPANALNFDLASFSLQNKQLLTEGSMAPALKLKNLQNKDVPLTDFNNKILLIAFDATNCAANALANPVLNRISKKYASSNFSIVSIFTSEAADKVSKYKEANHLEFPVYLGVLQTKKAFKTVGTPNFYLVDKDGRIVKSVDGYNDDMEKELVAKIDEELKK